MYDTIFLPPEHHDRLALLIGSAPKGKVQTKVNDMVDFLISDAGGFWQISLFKSVTKYIYNEKGDLPFAPTAYGVFCYPLYGTIFSSSLFRNSQIKSLTQKR